MKENILIVEDNPEEMLMLREDIQKVADEATGILEAKSASEALRIAKRGDIAYCALDLGMPLNPGEAIVGVDEQCRLGFDVLREILSKNTHVEIRVLSRHTDINQINQLLRREFKDDARILGAEDKKHDSDYIGKVVQDVMGLTALRPTLDRIGVRVVHPLERRLARKLWKIANLEWSWPTPRLVLRGESQAGKDRWAKALPKFRAVRKPCENRADDQSIDLGRIRDAGDSPLTALFGSENYQGIRGSHGGLFEKATHNNQNGTPDFLRSNFAILSELGNLPADCQPLLLEVLRDGYVTRAGVGNPSRPIGCGFIFTTNARLEDRVEESDLAGGNSLRRDLFERLNLTDDGWLFVPAFKDMGIAAFNGHLRLALEAEFGDKYEIAPMAQGVIEDAFQANPDIFTQRSIETIVKSFSDSGSTRLTADHVKTLAPRRSSKTIRAQKKLKNDVPEISVESDNEVLRKNIVTTLGLANLKGAWTCDAFAKACREKSFSSQKEYEKFDDAMAQIAGRDRSAKKQRNQFIAAIGYEGEDLLGFLGQIRAQIVKRNEKLKAVNRLKPPKKV